MKYLTNCVIHKSLRQLKQLNRQLTVQPTMQNLTSVSPPSKHLQGEIHEESSRGHGIDQTLSSMSCFQPYQNWDTNLYTIAMQNPS